MAAVSPHPLTQLTADEFVRARDVVTKQYAASQSLYFRQINLEEPSKESLVPYLEAEHAGRLTPDTPRPPRQAHVEYDVIKPDRHEAVRAVVDLHAAEVVSSHVASPTSHPYYTPDEFAQFFDLCMASDMFKEAMSEFVLPCGFEITIDPWPYGSSDNHDDPRMMQGLVFARDARKSHSDTNHYGYPIPIIPVMDWVTKKMIRVDRLATGGCEDGLDALPRGDTPKTLFANSKPAEWVPDLLDQQTRADLKPLNVVQPEGPSFTIQADKLVEWQKWRFRLGFTPREGAVLHDVCYQNRPVFYRLSFSELTVPYGDPRPPFHRKHAFDFGDGGVGRMTNSLVLGCDCLGAIHYLDALLSGPDGSPVPAKSVVCVHEQDSGVLWKHTNFRTNKAVVARSRELVVQFICTLANYEYIFAFKLDLAGGITLETRATGIVSVVAIDQGKTSSYGNLVAPGVLAQNHQHIIAARIDPAIDSYRDSQVVVEESHGVKKDPKTNPYGNLYQVKRQVVDRATYIDAEPRLNRNLKLENPSKRNAISGKNVAYQLVAPATQMMLADEESVHCQRAQFARHHAWVTGYRDGEFWVAGEFTNQSRLEVGGVGDMVRRGDWFTEQGKPDGANGSDGTHGHGSHGRKSSPVVWPVYGFTHNPRVEDWPVMQVPPSPMEMHQIHLRPVDFFEANPALDVPSATNESSVLVPCCGTDGATSANGCGSV
ncbi:copper amine oxidase 1 [Metarhizium album ARSEF 1941]|uniref:Amine oxidase n=1 Tax=Metarhizium album (strain ARSEF 1941) TaxID=1081103 RepID=A0A0B2X4T0_METAS|nr:copper amine oxidase 1 [Metarhizium album ARSEF 1941]KHO01369.1 copper amine oxidase 1 [Metarhizium album ARSEF 1941]